ncbi:hypothetical protein DSL92_01695 [Billgrantia gudaonensis]|uniref:Uncharacterized protein n=1 Tax=Billgrantia gudaonensis TaxID=376427 RepID=A0A3S0R5E6_9GAMM|nr:hypothetical protein DSL92_01695 [Halomonas gudaonensis]
MGGNRGSETPPWRWLAPGPQVIDPRPVGRVMNAGARASHGERLLFLHADTSLPKRADRRVERTRPGRTAGALQRAPGRSSPSAADHRLAMNRRSRLTGIATGDQALFMTREAYEAVGGFPSSR